MNIVIYAIVALLVRRKAEVTYGVCRRHQLRRRIFIAVGWIGFAGAFLLMAVNLPAGFAAALAAVLVGIIGSRIAYPRRITKEEVYLAGCGEAFLASLDNEAETPIRAGLGSCPQCHARLPMDAPACLKCKTVFAPGGRFTSDVTVL